MRAEPLVKPRSIVAQLRDVAECLHAVRGRMTFDSRDWGADGSDAWLYAVLVGWECEGGCDETDDPMHTCDGALRAVAERHRWDDAVVARVRHLRVAMLAAGAV